MRKPPKFGARIRPRQCALPDRPGPLESLFAHELLTTTEASEFLRIPVGTLEYWRRRATRSGPPFIRAHAHRILYRLTDLEDFLGNRTVHPEGNRKKGM